MSKPQRKRRLDDLNTADQRIFEAAAALNEQRQIINRLIDRYDKAVQRLEKSTRVKAIDDVKGTQLEEKQPKLPIPLKLSRRQQLKVLLSKTWTLKWEVMNVTGFLIALSSLFALVYDYRPLMLVTVGTLLNSADPMSMQFNVTNSGKLPIKSVQFSCILNQLETTGRIKASGLSIGGQVTRTLRPSEQTTFACPFDTPSHYLNDVIYADVSIRTRFELSNLPWMSTAEYRFITSPSANGLVWLPAPVNEKPSLR